MVALGGGGKNTKFMHDWPDVYPCLPNVAFLTHMKILGYIDLPGIEFPTGVTAVGNHEGGRVNGLDGHAGITRSRFGQAAVRDMFYKGGNAGYSSTAGFAVVIGKYESKAAFLDLQALFQRAREMSYTSEENFQKTRIRNGSQTMAFLFRGGSIVETERSEGHRCARAYGGHRQYVRWKRRPYIASRDGKVGLYKLGGLATEAIADPEAIQRVSEVQVGRNPTWLAYQKYSMDTVVAVSRGDREIAWIRKTSQPDPR